MNAHTAQNDPLKFEPPGETEWLRLEDIDTDRYQRAQKAGKVERIVANFDPRRLTDIVVNRRANGDVMCLDGGHRCAALRILGVTMVRATVHEGLTYEQEAALHGDLNRDPTRMGAFDLFKSDVEAKRPQALRILATMETHGFHPGRVAEKGGINSATALYQLDAAGWLDTVLSFVERCWPDDKQAVEANSLLGIGLFFNSWSKVKTWDESEVYRTMSRVTPAAIARDARELAYKTNMTIKTTLIAYAMADEFNKGKRKPRQLTGRVVGWHGRRSKAKSTVAAEAGD